MANQNLATYSINNGAQQPKKNLQDVFPRWNSIFFMLKCFLELEDSLRETLGLLNKPSSSLEPEQWIIIKEMYQILHKSQL